MIVRKYDFGWGPEWPLKALEDDILTRYLGSGLTDNLRSVLINSTWYGKQQHQSVLVDLDRLSWDQIVLVSMIDAPIPKPHWFERFDRPVLTVGNYVGDNDIVFWAQVIDQFFTPVTIDFSGIDTAYICLNRKPHWHRRRLYQSLESAGILDHGLVSMGQYDQRPPRIIDEAVQCNRLAPNGAANLYGMPNDIVTLGDLDNWRRCFLNVVTETVFDIQQENFVSEKIFKPMMGLRPFLVYSTDGAVKWLRERGFEPYTQDFRDITDLDLAQPENIVPFLQLLCDQPQTYIKSKIIDLQAKILYNKRRFTEFVKEQQFKINQGIQCPI